MRRSAQAKLCPFFCVILIVDDEPGIRDFLEVFFRGKGYPVVTAASAEEALDRWEEQQSEINAVITDIVMPGMDGKMLGEKLRAERSDLPVFYMSGYLPEEIAVETLNGPFFKKPFNPLDLANEVDRIIG